LARSLRTRSHLEAAAAEERDHLAWCAERIAELGGRKSALDPFWYASSFCLGALSAALSDAHSLGFVSETERQVEAHLNDHLRRLPEGDRKSRSILLQMAEDEARHGATAAQAGGTEMPLPIRRCMALGGGVLRRLAFVV
jgi:ubiquinone biosynthesis monooxygenase Coq7